LGTKTENFCDSISNATHFESHRGGHATALGEVKPFKDALNKSESCRYNASGLGEGAPHDRWTSKFCNFRGATFSEVVVI